MMNERKDQWHWVWATNSPALPRSPHTSVSWCVLTCQFSRGVMSNFRSEVFFGTQVRLHIADTVGTTRGLVILFIVGFCIFRNSSFFFSFIRGYDAFVHTILYLIVVSFYLGGTPTSRFTRGLCFLLSFTVYTVGLFFTRGLSYVAPSS